MIAKSYIADSLKSLDHKYRKTTSNKECLFLSKLALLELGGWIEETMDDIVLRHAKRHLKQQRNYKKFESEYVKRNYGFDYDKHFGNMLIRLLGLTGLERLERKVGPSTRDLLKSHLSSLKLERDRLAHTHLKGVTTTISAPSNSIATFSKISKYLTEYDRVLRASSF